MTTLGAVCLPRVPPEQLRDIAAAADAAGLDELWLWEDCFWGGAVPACAALLAWTTRLRVGIGVLPAPLRSVATTAMDTAMLHRLFPGRRTGATCTSRMWRLSGRRLRRPRSWSGRRDRAR